MVLRREMCALFLVTGMLAATETACLRESGPRPDWMGTGLRRGHGIGDINGDGFDDAVFCRDADGGGGGGQFSSPCPSDVEVGCYVFLGSTDGLGAEPSWASADAPAATRDLMAVGDVNGDGFHDVVTVYTPLFMLPGSGDGIDDTEMWSAAADGPWPAERLAVGADVDGDGFDDLVVGPEALLPNMQPDGTVMVFPGSPSGLPPDPATVVDNPAVFDFGTLVSVGDINGDGFEDVVIFARGDSSQLDAAFLHFGSPTGLDPNPAWSWTDAGVLLFSAFVKAAGDVDGDGFADLLIGDAFEANDGSVRRRIALYRGTPTGPETAPSWTFEDSSIGFPERSAAGGDVDGDGYDDIVLTTRDPNGSDMVVRIYPGSADGPAATPVASDIGLAAVTLPVGNLTYLGDVNGDGFDDVAGVVEDTGTGGSCTDFAAAAFYARGW